MGWGQLGAWLLNVSLEWQFTAETELQTAPLIRTKDTQG